MGRHQHFISLSAFSFGLALLAGIGSLPFFFFTPASAWGADAFPGTEKESLLAIGIGFYQKLLSPVLASECYMAPSCSRFSRQALDTYGPLLGLILTIDRFFHEADEAMTSPLIREGKAFKLYDPPAANLWWLRTPPPSPEAKAGNASDP